MEQLDFAMRMQDELSKPNAEMAASLRRVEQELHDVELQTMRLKLEQMRAQVGPKTLAQAQKELTLSLRIQRAELANQQDALNGQAALVRKLQQEEKAAARQQAAALRQQQQEQKAAAKAHAAALGSAEEPVSRLTRGFHALEKVAGGALHYIGERIAGLALAAPGLAVAGAQFAVDALAFKESTLASLELMLGGPKQARDMFASNLYLAKKTPFETADVVTAMKQIMSAGFDAEDANTVFQAIGDISAASGFSKEVFGQMSLAFSQIKGAGRLMGGELLQVLNATAQAGVGRMQIFEQIAKIKGGKPQDMAKAMAAGQISSMEAIVGIVNAIREKSGGRVGEIMMRQSTTLKGLFSTLSSAPMDFFLSMDIDRLEGLNPFKKFIENLVGDEGVLNTARESGQRIQAVLENTFNRVFKGVFGGLAGEGGKAKLEAVIVGAVEGLGSLVEGVVEFGAGFAEGFGPFLDFLSTLGGGQGKAEGMAASMRKVGTAAGNIAEALGYVVVGAGWALNGLVMLFDPAQNPNHPFNLLDNIDLGLDSLKWWWQDVKNWFANLWMDAKDLARNVALGMVTGIEETLHLPAGAVGRMANVAVLTAKSALDIHSPSRVFARIGRNVAEGYARGIETGDDIAAGAVGGLVRPPQAGPGGGGGGGRGVTIIVQAGALQVTVQGGAGDVDGMYQRLAASIRDALPVMLEHAVVEAGLVGV